MLQAIRSKASSLVVKIMFGVLIVTFGIWGIGDIFRNRGTDTSVATVGDRKIDAQELSLAVRQDAERLRQALRGAPLDNEQLKQLGIVDNALQQLINRNLVDLEIKRLNLAVGDDAVRQLIRSNPGFQNESGAFDPARLRAYAAAQHMTVPQFEATLRADLVRLQLNQAVSDGFSAPPELVDALYRSRAEKRVAEVLTLPESAAGDPGKPSESDITAYYDQHQDDFRVPELRSFDLGVLLLDDVAAAIKVPEDKLRDEYQNRLGEFHTPEERSFQQILLPDEAKAKAAAAELAQGKDFAQVAKDFGAAPDTLDLGFFKKDDLPAALGGPAFALKEGESTAPIQDTLGWHILHLTQIKPETTQPFEEVKDKLAKEVARDMAGDQIAKLANQIDDALAGGAALDEVAQRFGLKLSKIENVDANGSGADGKPVELPSGSADILKTAFNTGEGQTSPLNELGENGYYVLHVDKVTPASVKPLDEVREQVIDRWQQEKRDEALAKLAQSIVDEVKAGKKLAEIAAARKLQVYTTEPLQRSARDAKLPPALVADIFAAKPGAAVSGKGNDGYVVAQVKDVQPPDPVKDAEQMKQFAERGLTPSMRDDLLQEFDQALRSRYPVTIDQSAVARAF
jgi:peptidyl-prolyl cis-trans isomerase D